MDDKITVTLEIQNDQNEWLETIVQEYSVPDSSKALRILLDYAIQEADPDEVFNIIRCHHCG